MKALRSLAGGVAPRDFVQAHVDAWLQPVMDAMDEADRKEVSHAYLKADRQARQKVRQDLGLP